MKSNTNSIEAVLLDWDGTLLDSFEADTAAYLEMFRKMGIGWGRKELARHYSPDWYRVYRAARLERARWEEADRAWREAYAKHQPQLIEGTRRVLRRLRGRYALGLVTSGDCGRVTAQLRRLRLASTFAARICHEDSPRRKPHPEPLLKALAQMRIAPRAAVYVGDAPEDIQMARRAGVRAIGVLGSFPTAQRLRDSRPEALLGSLRELPGVIEEWSGRGLHRR
ncbi:MAG: HAD family hydrolase [Acidobacteriota bacterium]|nr:HAD family hydrolase [Acidobacteriota bacterium]